MPAGIDGGYVSSELTVSELAHELHLPASVLLEECHRLGIDAGWAGGTLTAQQAGQLRDRLGPTEGGDGPLKRRGVAPPIPSDRSSGSVPVVPGSPPPAAPTPGPPSFSAAPSVPSVPSVPSGSGRAGGLPPTAVGSIPSMARPPGGSGHEPGPLNHAENAGPEAVEVSNRSLASQGRRFDGTARTAAIAGILGVVLLLVAPSSPHVVATVAAWVGALVAGLVALFAGNRSRYKISTHPERLRGLPVAISAIVVGVLVLVTVGTGVWVVVRGAPTSSGPSVIADRSDVAELRWTYQRVRRIAGNGWNRPTKEPETCWDMPRKDDEPRTEERVEVTYESVSCRGEHDAEVLGVFALLPRADVTYPGEDELVDYGQERCAPVLEALPGGGDGIAIIIEFPTKAGWEDADHDVACVAMASRRGSLTEPAEAADPDVENDN